MDRVRQQTHTGVFLADSTAKMCQSLKDLATEIAAPEGDAGDRPVPLEAP